LVQRSLSTESVKTYLATYAMGKPPTRRESVQMATQTPLDTGSAGCGLDTAFTCCPPKAFCTVPTMAEGVLAWSGTNCASGAADVAAGTTCTITPASGFTCTSPGECQTDGSFASTGACEPLDCDAGYRHWQIGWSEMKKEYCCKTEGKGCA